MERIMIKELNKNSNEEVMIMGWVHKIRKLSKISFLILRDRTGMVQCVIDHSIIDLKGLKQESVIKVIGRVKEANNSTGKLEINVESINIISEVKADIPIEINKESLEVNIDTMLNNRVLSLRHIRKNAIFKIQAALAQGFAEFLIKNEFTQVFTPKIVSEGAEGGTAIFEVKYFDGKAYLTQSPQFYKQMLVAAGYERVFEVGHVYRAEEHNTLRHLNEYVSLDLEVGFIEDEFEIMELETKLLTYMMNYIKDKCEEELKLLKVELPHIGQSIPKMKLSEAIEILRDKYGKIELEEDLDPEGERLIGKYAKEYLNSDFLFLTHYSRKKRPMYTMPLGENLTHSFDLLYKGLEITTGGQRIHEYEELKENMIYKGLKPENFLSYLEVFKYGMPPHGGLAIGLERLTAQLLEYKNVRETSLFPRDRDRINP